MGQALDREFARRGNAIAVAVIMSLAMSAGVRISGAEPAAHPGSANAESSSRADRDDAALRDVFFTSARRGFAVGDRGTILRTDDAGENWSLLPCDCEASLRSICFVSEKEGWIAGGGTREYSGQSFGVVLATQDGGQTWTTVCKQGIPTVHKVEFFNDADGVALGDVSDRHATGVLLTQDGGRTWTAAPGEPTSGWRTGEFASPTFGLLAGERGAVGSLAGGAVVRDSSLSGLRGFKASSLDRPTKTVWAVGDGGMIVRTSDGGATWPAADTALPPETKMVFDFSAVAALKDQVWVGGSPGSAIWHSPDGGATWQAQPTRETTPLFAIRCLGSDKRIAVGALGKILLSNGDDPWRTVRGAQRRLAALAVHAHGSRVSLMQLTRDAHDRGYRVGAWSLVRRDVEPGTDRPAHESRRLEDAVLSVSAASGVTDWRLPVSLPGIERQPQALMAEWSVLADQKLNDVLVATLATQIRMWRPDVILLDDAPADDVPTQVVQAALPLAIAHARGNQGRMSPLWTTSALPEWTVKRIYSRSLTSREGEVVLDPFEWLPQRQMALSSAASAAATRLGLTLESVSRRETFHAVELPGMAASPSREFFSGLALGAGGDARRPMPPSRLEDNENLLQAVTRQRNFQKMSLKLLDQPGQAQRLLGQLNESVRDMPADQAALTLAMLGDDLRRRSDWETAEATFMELVTRYPDHPASRDAMCWLITLWTSSEIEYERGRRTEATQTKVELAGAAEAPGRKPVTIAGGSVFVGDLASVLGAGARAIDSEGPQGSLTGRRRLDAEKRFAQARQILDDWKRVAPDDVAASELQLQLAALYRRHDKHPEAEAIYTELVQNTTGATQRVAHGELWLVRPSTQSLQTVYRAFRAARPPQLDGVLADDCWQVAKELRVGGAPQTKRRRDEGDLLDMPEDKVLADTAFCMLAYDGAYLYIAASVPRNPALPKDAPSYAGRPYDADLDAFDRISVALDINRDYASAYRLDIDQRGWTRDALWTNQGWNPKWHVACDADERNWRAEAAIAWSELCPQPPAAGSVFALGVIRTMPAIGRQSWIWPGTDPIEHQSMGLLMLD